VREICYNEGMDIFLLGVLCPLIGYGLATLLMGWWDE